MWGASAPNEFTDRVFAAIDRLRRHEVAARVLYPRAARVIAVIDVPKPSIGAIEPVVQPFGRDRSETFRRPRGCPVPDLRLLPHAGLDMLRVRSGERLLFAGMLSGMETGGGSA